MCLCVCVCVYVLRKKVGNFFFPNPSRLGQGIGFWFLFFWGGGKEKVGGRGGVKGEKGKEKKKILHTSQRSGAHFHGI